jgi:hypothetical protein
MNCNCGNKIEKSEQQFIQQNVFYQKNFLELGIPVKKSELTTGKYNLYFNISNLDIITATNVFEKLSKFEGKEIDLFGKRIKLEKVAFSRDLKHLILTINVIINPFPVAYIIQWVLIISGVVAGIIFLEKIEKIIEVAPESLTVLGIVLILLIILFRG